MHYFTFWVRELTFKLMFDIQTSKKKRKEKTNSYPQYCSIQFFTEYLYKIIVSTVPNTEAGLPYQGETSNYARTRGNKITFQYVYPIPSIKQ